MARRPACLLYGHCMAGLAEEVGRHVDVRLHPIESGVFENDNRFVRVPLEVSGTAVYVLHASMRPVDTNLMELLMTLDAAKRAGASYIVVVTTYLPYVRSNHQHRPGESVAAKLVADLMTAAGADDVIIVDPIADQVEGFFGRAMLVNSRRLIACDIRARHHDWQHIVIALDVMSVGRSIQLAHLLGVPFGGMLFNRRVTAGQRVREAMVPATLDGRDVLLYDDEIDTGRSMASGADVLAARGAHRIAAVSPHGVFVDGACRILRDSPLCEVLVTNSLPPPHDIDGVRYVSIAPLLAEAIVHRPGV
jgi:ribose-phosphate pyrophosphokinase